MFDFINCFKNLAKIRKNAELSEKLAKFILNLKYPLLKNKFTANISSFCSNNIEKIAVLNIYLDVCLSFKFYEL
jgi:hypothetical protein